MQPTNKQLRISGALILSAMLLWMTLAAQTASQKAPAPDRNLAPPGAQRPAPPQPQKQLPGTRAPQPILPKLNDGAIQGYVYWDTSLIVHKPAGSCSGLAVTVSMDNGQSAPFKGFKPLATLTNNFKYVGQVKSFLYGGKVVTYDVCTYGYREVPVGLELQVQLTVTPEFSRNAGPQPAVVGPITLTDGKCSVLPQLKPAALTDLTAHWSSCQKMAFGVSFALQQELQTLSAGGGQGKSDSNSGALTSQGMLATSSTAESQRALGGAGTLAGNRNAGLLGDGSVHAPLGGRSKAPRTAVRLSAPKQGRKITNPKASLQDAGIIAVLRKQRSAAEAEAAQMKLGIRPAGVQASPGPTQTMASTGPAPGKPAPAPLPTAHLPEAQVRRRIHTQE